MPAPGSGDTRAALVGVCTAVMAALTAVAVVPLLGSSASALISPAPGRTPAQPADPHVAAPRSAFPQVGAAQIAAPRIAPVEDANATDEQRAILRSRETGGTGARELRTYAHHPVLAKNLLPFAHYIATGSTLPPRHRALLILRTAWLCRSAYTWAHHAKAARAPASPAGAGTGGPGGASLDHADLERIARGPDAAGWQPFEATLLRVADELHVNAFVSDATWQALTSGYDTPRAMDAVFTVAEITMIAGTVNSLRIANDDDAREALPTAIPYRTAAAPTMERLIGRSARITPVEPADWTPEMRAWLDRANTGRPVAAIYRTYARHLAMDKPRTLVSEHIRQTSTLTARERELLILRIGWLCRSEYEWAAHAPAGRRAGLTAADFARIVAPPSATLSTGRSTGGRSTAGRSTAGRSTNGTAAGESSTGATSAADIDAHLIRAVDELHRDDVVSDATWTALAQRYDTRQLLDILTTIGGYRMVSMALNTFGVQLEAGAERFPR